MMPDKPTTSPPFFSTGEMSERARVFDWALTALGEMSGWPDSLFVATGMMLRSRMQIVLFGGPGLVVLYNDASRAMLGHNHAQCFGMAATEAFDNFAATELHAQLTTAVSSGESFHATNQRLWIDQPTHELGNTFDVFGDPVIDDTGMVTGVYCTFVEAHRDGHTSGRTTSPSDVFAGTLDALPGETLAGIEMTDLRLVSEQVLRASEEKYRNLFNSIDEGFCILDVVRDRNGVPVDLFFVEINEAFERQTGMPNPIGKLTSEVVPGLEKAWVDVYSRVADTGVVIRFEEEAAALNRWFDVYASRVGGPGSARVAVVFRDVTARKHKDSRTELLDDITEDLMRLATPRSIMETVGKRVSEALGLSSFSFVDVDEVRDEAVIEFGWVGDDVELLRMTFALSDYLTEDFRRAARAGEVFVVSDASTDPRTNRDAYARLGIGAFVVVPFHWEGRWNAYMSATTSQPRAWTADEVALIKEISIRLFASVERARVGEALDESNRRKDEFLATLAHELRNPLAPIRSGVEVLRLSGPASQAPIVDVIDRQAAHLVRLVDDLMEVSRITRGKIELRREIIDLKQVLRAAVETAGPVLDASRTTFTLSLPEDRVLVDADAVRLGQIFTNLLNNAAKYTDAGGQITLKLECKGAHAVVCIRDSGTGIPAEMLPRVFDLFTQVDRTLGRAQGGLGIGLALVRSLVELHNGRVEAASDGPGKGSEFLVRLPLASVDRTATRTPPHVDQTGQQPLTGKHVLIVDDNRDAANTMALLLQHLGAVVQTEYRGDHALHIIEQHKPDVAFVDIGMPGMDGYTVAQRVRGDLANAAVKLVALTGWGQEQDVRRAHEAGFDHHLVKPANAETVLRLFQGWSIV